LKYTREFATNQKESGGPWSGQRDPEVVEELDRMLKYMEKAINQLKTSINANQSKSK